jgi:excisionase family DNA binding protein
MGIFRQAQDSVQPAGIGERRARVQEIRSRERGKPYLTPALFTVSEAAKYLGVGRAQVYRLIEWGEIKAVKLGRSIQVQKDSLDRFRASGKIT